jgi:ABC-type sulfate transport system substrate-binding protein
MLCAFYIEQILIQKDFRVAAVLDYTRARQGCGLIYNQIIAYEDFLYSDLGGYIFIITSERMNDLSIASTIMEHFPGASYLFWQSLFDD